MELTGTDLISASNSFSVESVTWTSDWTDRVREATTTKICKEAAGARLNSFMLKQWFLFVFFRTRSKFRKSWQKAESQIGLIRCFKACCCREFYSVQNFVRHCRCLFEKNFARQRFFSDQFDSTRMASAMSHSTKRWHIILAYQNWIGFVVLLKLHWLKIRIESCFIGPTISAFRRVTISAIDAFKILRLFKFLNPGGLFLFTLANFQTEYSASCETLLLCRDSNSSHERSPYSVF